MSIRALSDNSDDITPPTCYSYDIPEEERGVVSGRAFSDNRHEIETQRNVRQKHSTTTGVLLWGPPGCGKSTTADNLSRQYSPMYFINTDAIVESTISNYFQEEFLEVKTSGTMQEKERFYFRMRSVSFKEVCTKCKINPETIIYHIFSDVYRDLIAPSNSELLKYQLQASKSERRVETKSDFWYDLPINASIGNLSVFLAKFRGHNFMIETVGSYLDLDWIKTVFGDVHSILQVVYVSSVDDLISRVSKRTAQLINASPARIAETYSKSYFDVFADAVSSNSFEKISVDVNDKRSFNAVQLKKTARGYVIDTILFQKEREEPTSDEIEFIRRLFVRADLPVEFLKIAHVTHTALSSSPQDRPYVIAGHVFHTSSLFDINSPHHYYYY